MADLTETRVAVYIDFDNIVISRYNQLHGRGSAAQKVKDLDPADPETAKRLDEATVDLGAVLDFASSFGTVAVSRAYADWSVPVNADYSKQLIQRAVDLIQLFPTVASGKNGADIRLALDVSEDLFRLPHLTHVVIVAGDSDYISLAQRCKQLGRYVVGIGVAGSTSRALAYACNEFKDYDKLPGVSAQPRKVGTTTSAAKPATAPAARPKTDLELASELLLRAIQLLENKGDGEWISPGGIKNQMLRLDPTFQERALGFATFTAFLKAVPDRIEFDKSKTNAKIRLRSGS